MEFTSQELAGLAEMYGNGELTSEDIDVLTQVFGVTLPSSPPSPPRRRQPKRPLRLVSPAPASAPAPALPSHILTEMPPMKWRLPQMSEPGRWVTDLTSDICSHSFYETFNN